MPEDPPSSPTTNASFAAAFDAARERLAAAPEDPEALSSLVTAGVALGGIGAMLTNLEKLEDQLPDRPDLGLMVAKIRFQLGFAEATIESTERLIGRSPNDIDLQARQFRVRALLKLDRLGEAETAIGELIRRGFGARAIGLLAQLDLSLIHI